MEEFRQGSLMKSSVLSIETHCKLINFNDITRVIAHRDTTLIKDGKGSLEVIR